MRLAALALLAAFAATPALAAGPAVGDTLSCVDGRAVVVVGRIDQLRGKTIASVSLFDQVPGSPLADMGHLPIEMSALRAGCARLSAKRPLSDNFEGGYALWREAFDLSKAGYFTAPVDQILDGLLSSLPREGGDL